MIDREFHIEEISRGRKKYINLIKELSDEQQDSALDLFNEELPSNFLGIIKKLSDELNFDREKVFIFLSGSVSEYTAYYRANQSIDDYLKSDEYEGIKDFMRRILSMEDSLGIISKCFYFETVLEETVGDISILTDFRPIYFKDPLKQPEYGIIKHNLNIEIVKYDGIENVVLSLRTDSLKRLKKVIERAINKEKTLENQLKENNIKIIRKGELINE
jgi:hypothetical protein